MSDRKCIASNQNGEPCDAPPLKDAGTCLAHADEETRASAGFGGSRAGAMGGRPRVPRATELMRRLVEENAVAVLRPYFLALGYDVEIGDDGPRLVEHDGGGAKLFGESKDGTVVLSPHPDLAAMIAASERLQDRVYGRPRQAIEHTGDSGGPVAFAIAPPDPDRALAVARILQEAGALPSDASEGLA